MKHLGHLLLIIFSQIALFKQLVHFALSSTAQIEIVKGRVMALKSFRDNVTQTWPPPPTFTEANVPAGSQKEQVFIVTGGNSGI